MKNRWLQFCKIILAFSVISVMLICFLVFSLNLYDAVIVEGHFRENVTHTVFEFYLYESKPVFKVGTVVEIEAVNEIIDLSGTIIERIEYDLLLQTGIIAKYVVELEENSVEYGEESKQCRIIKSNVPNILRNIILI